MNPLYILIIQNTNSPHVYTDTHVQQIKHAAPESRVTISADPDSLSTSLKNAEIIILSSLKEIDISKAPGLKWIHVTSAGVNEIAQKLQNTGIILTNSSGVHPIPIAEHIVSFMLMFARQIHVAHRIQIVEKAWKKEIKQFPVFELVEKTVAIIGYGRIGARAALYTKALGMKVLSYATSQKSSPHVDEWYTEGQLTDIVKKSDFVVNCLPLTDKTHHLFDRTIFSAMKPTAYFINIGRGPSVVEQDLIEALQQQTIAGAGLDVFEQEPLPSRSPLWKMENVIITPHYAGLTPRYADRVIDIFCENLRAFMQNKTMPTAVDKEKGY